MVHLILLVEEATSCIGDRDEVVTNLGDLHAAHHERYALMCGGVTHSMPKLCLTKV